MRGMAQAQEIFQAPPPGTYPIRIVAAEAGVSTKGNSQLVLSHEIIDGKYKGEQFMDWVLTDPSAKGAGIGRTKLRVLLKGTQYDGLADAGSENEVPDNVIAQALVGRTLFAVIDNSPRKKKDEAGNRTSENMTQIDPATGQLVTVMNADVKGYTLHGVAAQTQAPVQGAQTFTQVPTQTFQATQTGTALAGAPQPTVPFQPNFQPQAATPPWAQNNGAQSQAQEPAKKAKKLQLPAEPQ